jgi:GNAT superfamily N-acetyltransferase
MEEAGLRIRKFRKGDAKEVSRLKISSQMEILKDYYPPNVVEFFCRKNTPKYVLDKSKEIELFVAVEKGKIIGVNGLKKNAVRSFYVLPSFIRKGVGRKLMENVEKIAIKRGIKKLIVHSSLYAEGFYRKCGFRKLRMLHNKHGNIKFDEIMMQKKL